MITLFGVHYNIVARQENVPVLAARADCVFNLCGSMIQYFYCFLLPPEVLEADWLITLAPAVRIFPSGLRVPTLPTFRAFCYTVNNVKCKHSMQSQTITDSEQTVSLFVPREMSNVHKCHKEALQFSDIERWNLKSSFLESPYFLAFMFCNFRAKQ